MIVLQQFSDGFAIKVDETVYHFPNEDNLYGLAELLTILGLDCTFEIVY